MRRHTGIAAFSDLRTPSSDGVRDAVTTRPSASANFFVDSTNRVGFPTSTPADFTINKKQSLFNGFFNRIAVNEIVLNWGLPNIAAYWGNNTITIENDTTAVQFPVTIADGFYRVVDLLEYIADEVNTQAVAAGDPLRLQVQYAIGEVQLVSVGVGNDPFIVLAGKLASQLYPSTKIGVATPALPTYAPLILGTKYIDIVSQQLTYNQDLKDNTTSDYNRDVLYRWYFTYDNVPVAYDYITAQIAPGDAGAPVPYPPTFAQVLTDIPIIEGYTSFVSRRTPPVVKQIRWSPEQPIGQVTFQVYDDSGKIIDVVNGFDGDFTFDFQMSMLLSED